MSVTNEQVQDHAVPEFDGFRKRSDLVVPFRKEKIAKAVQGMANRKAAVATGVKNRGMGMSIHSTRSPDSSSRLTLS